MGTVNVPQVLSDVSQEVARILAEAIPQASTAPANTPPKSGKRQRSPEAGLFQWPEKDPRRVLWSIVRGLMEQMTSPEVLAAVEVKRTRVQELLCKNIEEMCGKDSTGSVARRYRMDGLQERIYGMPGRLVTDEVFASLLALNLPDDSGRVVRQITVKEAEQIRAYGQEYKKAKESGTTDGMERPKFFYAVAPGSDDPVYDQTPDPYRDNEGHRAFVVCLVDNETFNQETHPQIQETHQIALYIKSSLEQWQRNQTMDSNAAHAFYTACGVEKGKGPLLSAMAGEGATGARQFMLPPQFPIGDGAYSGPGVVIAMTREAYHMSMGKELPEGMGAIRLRALKTHGPNKGHDIFALMTMVDGVAYLTIDGITAGDVAEIGPFTYVVDKVVAFRDLTDPRTGEKKDLIQTVLLDGALRNEAYWERKRSGQASSTGSRKPVADVPAGSGINYDDKMPGNKSERNRLHKRQVAAADRVRKSDRPSGKRERGGGDNSTRRFMP